MSASASPASAVILVVEDEALLRMHASDFIEAAGYHVLEAWTTDEAIRVLEARPEVRVVLTDINLPGSMDGLKMATVIRRRWPPVEIIVTSGAVRPSPEQMPARGVFIAKPADPRHVLRAIDDFVAGL